MSYSRLRRAVRYTAVRIIDISPFLPSLKLESFGYLLMEDNKYITLE